jgi:tetratricopeptide (TPR) repeat protein
MVRSPQHLLTVFALAVACALPTRAAEPAAATSAPASLSRAELDKLIDQLADKDFAIRDAADQRLRSLRWPAIRALIIGRANTNDEETRARIDSILSDLCWSSSSLSDVSAKNIDSIRTALNVPPPPDSVPPAPAGGAGGAAVGGARLVVLTGDMDVDFLIGNAVVAPGGAGVPGIIIMPGGAGGLAGAAGGGDLAVAQALKNFIESMKDARALANTQRAVAIMGPRYIDINVDPRTMPGWPAYLETLKTAARWDELEWLLATNGRVPELAALLRQRGNAAEFIEALQALQKSKPDLTRQLPKTILSLMVSLGREDDAIAAALTLKMPGIAEGLLAARPDWPALAKLADGADHTFVRAAALEFAGSHAAAQSLLQHSNSVTAATRAAILLGHADLAAGLPNRDLPDQITTLINLRRYRDAIAAYDNADVKGDDEGNACSYLLLPACLRVGDLEHARQIVASFDKFHPRYAPSRAEFAVLQARVQLRDFRSFAARLADLEGGQRLHDYAIAAQAFPAEDSDTISAWLHDLRPSAGLTAAELQQVADIASGRISPRDLADAANRAMNADLLLRAAIQFQRAGQTQLAGQFHMRFAYTHTLMHEPPGGWGINAGASLPAIDLLMTRDWKLTDALFEMYRSRGLEEPVAAIVGACVRGKLGDVAGAEKLLTPALRQIEGDLGRNSFLAKTFLDLGELDAAADYARAALDLQKPAAAPLYALMADIDLRRGRFPDALHACQMAVIAELSGNSPTSVARPMAYAAARVALAKNDPLAALAAGRRLVQLDPETLDLTLELIHALKIAGMSAQAAELLATNRALLSQTLHDFPNSTLHQALLARLQNP